MSAWLDADWPAPPGVRALTTLRHGLGVSKPPFDHFNLGARCGDEAEAVAENRRAPVDAPFESVVPAERTPRFFFPAFSLLPEPPGPAVGAAP